MRHLLRLAFAVTLALFMIPIPGQVSLAATGAHCSATYIRYLESPPYGDQPASILGEVRVVNDGDVPIREWRVHLDTPYTVSVTTAWSATATRSRPLFLGWLFTPMSYNSSLELGRTTAFGFLASDRAYPSGSAAPFAYCTASG